MDDGRRPAIRTIVTFFQVLVESLMGLDAIYTAELPAGTHWPSFDSGCFCHTWYAFYLLTVAFIIMSDK